MTDRRGSWWIALVAGTATAADTPHAASVDGDRPTPLRESYADLERKVEELTRELKQARDHEAAVSEVLRVISASQTDVQPVLDTVAERAATLCDAPYATLRLVEGDKLRRMSEYSPEGELTAVQYQLVIPIRGTVAGRAVLERRTVHIDDIVPLLDAEYPAARDYQPRLGMRRCSPFRSCERETRSARSPYGGANRGCSRKSRSRFSRPSPTRQ